jgi:hypothetical protein
LSVTLIIVSKPSVDLGRARIKSIEIVWKGIGGDEIGCRVPYGACGNDNIMQLPKWSLLAPVLHFIFCGEE